MVCPARGAMCTIRLKVRVRVSVGSLGRDRVESSRTRRTARFPAKRKVATRALDPRPRPRLQRASSVPGGRPGSEHGTRAGQGGRAGLRVGVRACVMVFCVCDCVLKLILYGCTHYTTARRLPTDYRSNDYTVQNQITRVYLNLQLQTLFFLCGERAWRARVPAGPWASASASAAASSMTRGGKTSG